MLGSILIIGVCVYLYRYLGRLEKDLDNGTYGRPYIDRSVNIDNRTYIDNRKITLKLPRSSRQS